MSKLNLFEKIALENIMESKGPSQRIYVRRQSLDAASCAWMEQRPHPIQWKLRRFLDAVPAGENLSPFFTLCSKWQQPEGSEFMELDLNHYSGKQISRPRGRAYLSFSLPVRITSKTWGLYLNAYRGHLFAYGILYYFTGDFEHPQNLREDMLYCS